MNFFLAILVAVVLSEATAQQYNNNNNNNNYYPPQQQQYGPPPTNNYYPQQQQQYNNNNNYNNKYNNNNYNNKYNNKNSCQIRNLGCALADIPILGPISDPYFFFSDFEYQFTSDNMTDYMCTTFCAGNFFTHSVTWNSTYCACGILLDYFPLDQQQCNTVCAGDTHQRCGSQATSEGCIQAVTLYATTFDCDSNLQKYVDKIYPVTCNSRVIQCSNQYTLPVCPYYLYEDIPYSTNEHCALGCAIEAFVVGFTNADTYGFTFSGTFNGTGCACLFSPGPAAAWSNCNVDCGGGRGKCGDYTDTYFTVSLTPIGCGLNALY